MAYLHPTDRLLHSNAGEIWVWTEALPAATAVRDLT